MKKRRFYIDEENIDAECFYIKEKEKYHLADVLRLNIGDIVYGVTDNGKEYEGRITSITSDKACCNIINIKEYKEKNNVTYSFLVSIIKEKRMSFILEKAVELGVSDIYPLVSERSSIFKKADLLKKKTRWENIVKAGIKQSGNLNPCNLKSFVKINQLDKFDFDDFTHMILLSPCSEFFIEEIFSDWVSSPKDKLNFLIVIGPEGGFTEKEEYLIKEKGAVSVCCQREVMRAETAFCYMASVIGLLKRMRNRG